MRTLSTILTIILIWTVSVNGQNDDCLIFETKNECGQMEIGANLFNLTTLSYNSSAEGVTMSPAYINGLMFKWHCNNKALRIGFDIFNHNFSYGWGPSGSYPWYYKNHGTTLLGELRVGYERRLTSPRIQPFFAVDLHFSHGQTKGISEGLGDFPPYSYRTEYKMRKSRIGIAPSVGLTYRLTDRLSLTIETNGSLTYFNDKEIESSTTDTGLRFYYNPLRLLSFNYHF